MNSAIDIAAIERALGDTPRVAYTTPHVYPHAAPIFETRPMAGRERVAKEYMRLYVHVPFCNYSCTFCCYAKRVGVKVDQMKRYLRALKRELEWIDSGTPVSQYFVGGGTPTALPAELLDELLEMIDERMPAWGTPVHTVEASPESISDEHIRVLKRHKVGRVSMGIQSLEKDILDNLSRAQGGSQTPLEACRRILDAGLILNVDLMYGLPNQKEGGFRHDFELAATVGVHAVTAYSLRLNEYTPVAKTIASEDQLRLDRLVHWRTHVRDTARALGFTQTRWHTFKRLDSIAARHERLPCFDDDMVGYQMGIGMSARSHLGYTVYRNHKGLNTYMERMESGQSPVEEVFPLKDEDRKTQYIARTIGDGKLLSLAHYQQSFGRTFLDDYGPVARRMSDGGLIEMDSETVRMTDAGSLLYDIVTLAFYPPRAKQWLLEKLKDYQVN